jgi:hypothetical protein
MLICLIFFFNKKKINENKNAGYINIIV